MAYSRKLSTKTPGLFVFLIDQSGSMCSGWGGDSTKSKAQQVADVMNRFISDMVIRCELGNVIRDRIYISAIGYGNPNVSSAFSGSLSSMNLVSMSDLANNPIRLEERIKKESDGAGGILEHTVHLPIWIEPIASSGTPMPEAFAHAYSIVESWVKQNQDSFPPIVINITDGAAANPATEVKRIMSLSTNDGSVLVFNVHISDSSRSPSTFPSILPKENGSEACMLYEISSELPSVMFNQAKEIYPNIAPGARGFAFNADLVSLVNFLNIGTSTEVGL